MAGYVNTVRAIVCFELLARAASNFCDFWKLTSCDFIAFISSLIEVNFFLIFMCLLRINLPILCPNMNHFDAVGFSECHSEEVISFFWRSVYFTSLFWKRPAFEKACNQWISVLSEWQVNKDKVLCQKAQWLWWDLNWGPHVQDPNS